MLTMQEQVDKSQYKLFCVYKTLIEILHARGYVVSQKDLLMTLPQFLSLDLSTMSERKIFTKLDQNQPDAAILVFFNFRSQKITQDLLIKMMSSVTAMQNFIVVCAAEQRDRGVDKKSVTLISDLAKNRDQVRIELFRDDQLMFNVLRHELVPEHRVLTNIQKDELLLKYKVKQSQLPKILLSDPVAKFLGLRRGQVVRINRKSQTAGTYTTYRIAI